MRLCAITPPRQFIAGKGITLSDVMHIEMAPKEQVIFETEDHSKFSVARARWGYEVATSFDDLPATGFHPVIAGENREKLHFLLCAAGKEAEFNAYLKRENMMLAGWLSDQPTANFSPTPFEDEADHAPFHSKQEVPSPYRLKLMTDENVTFISPSGSEYDVCRKSWGFYATPSFLTRLAPFGIRGVIVAGRGHKWIMLVESGAENIFETDLASRGLSVLVWMDQPDLSPIIP